MKIDRQTIYKVADLARIDIQEGEVDGMISEMSKILTFMEKLSELDTLLVAPLVYMNNEVNIWREDDVIQEISVEEGLKNSANHNSHFFLVPKIIEK